MELQFAGANNPLYIIKTVIASDLSTNEERGNLINKTTNSKQIVAPPLAVHNDEYGLWEIKPDKMPIAIYGRMDKFTNHKIQLNKGDQLYLFSDGFADQFGGPTTGGKKFKYKPFKQLLIDNCQLSMTEQKEILEKTFAEWKGNNEQVDDVTVVGIKI